MKIVVYKTQSCSKCPSVIRYLTMKNAEYTVVDCSDDPKLIAPASKMSGVFTVPQTVYKGQVIVGLNYGRLAEFVRDQNDTG